MAKSTIKIPAEIKNALQERVDAFNKVHKTQYELDFRGRFCYLSRLDDRALDVNILSSLSPLLNRLLMAKQNTVQETKICKMTWDGDIDSWADFTPYLYSRDAYDTSGEAAWFMPGARLFDGTIEGAMLAGMEMYP
jgi:hypothetical protein